jgi:hypothetical protein
MLLRQTLDEERAASGYALRLPDVPTREQIRALGTALEQAEQQGHGVTLEAEHHFATGLVSRTILIPAGTCLVGLAHKAEHLNISDGDITVWTEAGMRRLTGRYVLPSMPGAQRAGYAHADTWWTTVHLNPRNERDPARLENELVEHPELLQSRRLAAVAHQPVEVLA